MAASMCKNVFLHSRCLHGRQDDMARKIVYLCTNATTIDKRTCSVEPQCQNAKGTLHNIMQLVASEFKNKSLMPKIHFKKIAGGAKTTQNWEATVTMAWPEPMTTTGTATTKSSAERIACWQAIQCMMKQNVLTKDFRPCLYGKEQLKTFSYLQNAPKLLSISYQVELRMKKFVNDYKELCRKMSDVVAAKNEWAEDHVDESPIVDVMTGRPLVMPGPRQTSIRNDELLRQLKAREQNMCKEAVSIRELQHSLPVHAFKDIILSSVDLNPVVVLSGETGCGKTTQLPQYILNEFITTENGSNCNIVATQPRRLAAISVASRVAHELNQKLGDTVGYQVRLASVMPRDRGAILFCTGGILLQRLVNNPKLEGVSHVVLDEAHERSVVNDFILVLLKDLVKARPSLRVVIMSASMNVEKLSNFFDGCPTIQVPGFTHPVKDHFQADILKMMGQHEGKVGKAFEEDSLVAHLPPPLNCDLIADLIFWIDNNRPPGGILCFLPGWHDINRVQNRLGKIALERGCNQKRTIITLHSLVPLETQSRVFEVFPSQERKIVLATNIAETSITVPDVSYVIDSGLCKDLYYDSKWGASSLQTQWVSQANVQQRRGRSGRTHPGECFHLYPQDVLEEMALFPVPEMRRISLEKVILDAELYSKNNAASFLACCPDPPRSDMVILAMTDLYERGFLTSDMKLTRLGACATAFACHPYVSKAVMYSRWMRCCDPLLTVAAYLSADNRLFRSVLDESGVISKIKKNFAGESASEFWAVHRIVEEWQEAARQDLQNVNMFCKEYFLSKSTLTFLKGVKENLKTTLQLLCNKEKANEITLNHSGMSNEYSKNQYMVAVALAAGFSPNFLRRMAGSVKKSRIVKDETWLKNNKGFKTHLQRDSVNYKCPPEWLTYLHMMQSGVGRYITVRETSAISPFAVILFGGQRLTLREVNEREVDLFDVEDPVVLSVDNNNVLSFYCSRSNAELLYEFRTCVSACFQYSLFNTDDIDVEILSACETEVLATLSDLFQSSNQTMMIA